MADEVNIFVLGDAGFKSNKLQKHVALAMDLYRQGKVPGQTDPVPLDAVVLTGDNFEDQPFSKAVTAQFEQAYEAFDVPFYVTLGNHDLPGKKAQAEWEYAAKDATEGGSPRWTVASKFPFTHYRVDLPSAENPILTLIELDSNGSARVKEGKKFLEQQIVDLQADPRKHWVAVFTHYPLYTNGCHQEGSEFPNSWKPLLQGNVHFYLCGHNHNLEHLEVEDPSGTPLSTSFILSGAGGQVYKLRSHHRKPFARSLAGFFHLRLSPEKAWVSAVAFGKKETPSDARIVHRFERDFANGQIVYTTPLDPNSGKVPLALDPGDLGTKDEMIAQCGEPPK